MTIDWNTTCIARYRYLRSGATIENLLLGTTPPAPLASQNLMCTAGVRTYGLGVLRDIIRV